MSSVKMEPASDNESGEDQHDYFTQEEAENITCDVKTELFIDVKNEPQTSSFDFDAVKSEVQIDDVTDAEEEGTVIDLENRSRVSEVRVPDNEPGGSDFYNILSDNDISGSEKNEQSDDESSECYNENEISDEENWGCRSSKRLKKVRQRNGEWIWNSGNVDQNIFKHPFSDTNHVKGGNPQSKFDCYRHVIGKDLWKKICTETNRNASECIAVKPNKRWFNATVDEIEAFFLLCILMSQVKKRRLKDYFSSKRSIRTPYFQDVMSFDRFTDILRYLHFDCKKRLKNDYNVPKLTPIIKYFVEKFEEIHSPSEELFIDETLMKFHFQVCVDEYNPTGLAWFGLKLYKLCDSKTGYCQSFSVYIKKPTNQAILLTLLKPYLNKGHTLFLNKHYVTPSLFGKLRGCGTNAVGIVHPKRKHVPKELDEEKLQKGEAVMFFSNCMSALKWQDQSTCNMLSTYHKDFDFTETKKSKKTGMIKFKPKVVVDYNVGKKQGKKAHPLTSLRAVRQFTKGYKKIFFYIMDIALYNSYCIWKLQTGEILQYDAFIIDLVEDVMATLNLPLYKKRGRISGGSLPMRLQAAHWAHLPDHIPTDSYKIFPTRKCVVCDSRGVKSDTRFECSKCLAALHVPHCFREYHTSASY